MRPGLRLTLLATVLVAVTFSGCAKARAAPPQDPFAQPEGFDDNTGSVEGLVIDEEFQPLAGAIVGFIDPYQAAKTDEAGHFEIGLLPPGKRNLYVIHLGHQADGKAIEIKTRESTHVQFILPLLPIEEPWIDVVQRRGQFERAVSTGTFAQINASAHTWQLRDQPGALEALVLEAEWRDASGMSGGLTIKFGLGGEASRNTFFTVTGKSPLREVVEREKIEDTWQKSKSVCVKLACILRWEATPAPGITGLPVDAGIMMDQPFDVYVSHFYRMPVPENYRITAG